jgi:hypothetical protein
MGYGDARTPTVLMERISADDYFHERELRGKWWFMAWAASGITPEIQDAYRRVCDALDEEWRLAVKDWLGRELGGDWDDIELVDGNRIMDLVAADASGGTTSLLRLIEENGLDSDTIPELWNQALEDLMDGFRAAVVAHRESCGDEGCRCRSAVTVAPEWAAEAIALEKENNRV